MSVLSALSQTLQTLHTFPSELWAIVFSTLDLQSWTLAQLVCKKWWAIANWSKSAVQARKESRWRNYSMRDLVAWTQSGNLLPLQYLLSRHLKIVQKNELYSIVGIAFGAANEVLVASSETQQRRQQRHLAIVLRVKHYCDYHKITLEGDTDRFFKKFLYFASGMGNLRVLQVLFANLQMLCYCLANTAAQEGRLNTLRWLVEEKNCRPHGHNIFTLACARGHYNTVLYMCRTLNVVPLPRDMELACVNDNMAIIMLFVILRVPFEQDARRKIFRQCVREASPRVIQYLINVKWITVCDQEEPAPLVPLALFGEDMDGDGDGGGNGGNGDGDGDGEDMGGNGEDMGGNGEDMDMGGHDEDFSNNMDGDDEDMDGDDSDEEVEEEDDDDDDDVITINNVMKEAYRRGDPEIISLLHNFFNCVVESVESVVSLEV